MAIPSARTDEVRYLEMEPEATVLTEINESLSEGCERPSHASIFNGAAYLTCAATSTIDCRAVPEFPED